MTASLHEELKFGTPEHSRILQEVRDRHVFSRNYMNRRHDSWKKAEQLFRAFVHETDEDAARRAKRDAGQPQYTTINLPYSYAMLLTAHTYWTSVFLARNPVFQYTGRHGEPQMKVQALEAIIDYQMRVGRMLVPLYVWLLDPGKYGFGVVGNYWAEEHANVSKLEEQIPTFQGVPIVGKAPVKRRVLQRIPAYMGNRLYNVRPHNFFPDPRVTLSNFQDGEFCGIISSTGMHTLIEREATGDYFNIDVLKRIRPTTTMSLRDHSGDHLSREDVLPTDEAELASRIFKNTGFVELLEMYVKIIPNDWKLGKSKLPEIWVFTVAGDALIIGARPLGLLSNRFPFFVQEYEVDGYSQSTRGMLEVMEDLNNAMSWLINSHFTNVRAALNNQAIVDPSRVNMKDFEEGAPGFRARIRPTAYGTDVRTVYTQIPTVDVTRSHINDLQVLAELGQRVTGVNDNLMGAVNPGGRKTATEVRTSSSFGINRLKTNAEFFSAEGWDPLSQTLVQNTQQLYDQEQQFKIAGNLAAEQEFINVTPDSLVGFFDFVPVDGTLPIDRFAQANLWKEVLVNLSRIPQIAAEYDVAGIFAWMAQLGGLKNISQFRVQVTPDQQVLRQAEQGNLIPIQGGRDPNAARPPGSSNAGQAGPTS